MTDLNNSIKLARTNDYNAHSTQHKKQRHLSVLQHLCKRQATRTVIFFVSTNCEKEVFELEFGSHYTRKLVFYTSKSTIKQLTSNTGACSFSKAFNTFCVTPNWSQPKPLWTCRQEMHVIQAAHQSCSFTTNGWCEVTCYPLIRCAKKHQILVSETVISWQWWNNFQISQPKAEQKEHTNEKSFKYCTWS